MNPILTSASDQTIREAHMSNREYVEKFERKYVDCVGQYIGPDLPGFPYSPGEIIHVNCLASAAVAFKYAKADALDRVRVSA